MMTDRADKLSFWVRARAAFRCFVQPSCESCLGVNDLSLDDVVESSVHGFLFYDQAEKLRKFNARAVEFVRDVEGIDDLDKLGAFILAHSLGEELDDEYIAGESEDFRNVIAVGARALMLQLQQTKGGGLIVNLTDVSNLRRKQVALLDLAARNHELVEAMEATSNGIVVSDPKQSGNPIIFANQAFCRMMGMTAEDMIGRDWVHVLGRQDGIEYPEMILRAMRQTEPMILEWSRGEQEDLRWYKLTLSPVLDRNNKPDLFIGIENDVTEAKMQEAQIFQSQKLEALGQLAGGVAHDFNNLLSIIDGYAHLVGKQIEDDPVKVEYLERIRLSVKRGAALTRQLLTFGRHKVISKSVFDIGDMIREQMPLLRPILDASIQLETNISDEGLLIECESDALSQIIMNLVINARDAMPAGGKVSLNLSKRSEDGRDYACLAVKDTGIGMDPETLKRIYDPFFTTKEQGKGTGLGLSMVYGIVKQLGGRIDVQSKPGKGAMFRILIPLSGRKAANTLKQTVDSIDGTRFNGYTVLVAEDEPDLLQVLINMLEEKGLKVIPATNGQEALVKLDACDGQVDFLLTDVVMPELNGLKLAELVKSIWPEINIMYMSGYPANGQMARVQLPEDACLLAKPVDYNMLARMMRTQIDMQSNNNMGTDADQDFVRQWQAAMA